MSKGSKRRPGNGYETNYDNIFNRRTVGRERPLKEGTRAGKDRCLQDEVGFQEKVQGIEHQEQEVGTET